MNVDSSCFLIFIGYLVGSVPSGLLISRLKGITDIRNHGSGNIGATNVARMLGVRYFFIVFFLDACKAYCWLWIVQQYTSSLSLLYAGAIASLAGNVCSFFLAGSGGKGVATSMGIAAFFVPYAAGIAAMVWTLFLCITRVAGYASVVTMISLPCIVWYITKDVYLLGLFAGIAICVMVLHRNYVYSMSLSKN